MTNSQPWAAGTVREMVQCSAVQCSAVQCSYDSAAAGERRQVVDRLAERKQKRAGAATATRRREITVVRWYGRGWQGMPMFVVGAGVVGAGGPGWREGFRFQPSVRGCCCCDAMWPTGRGGGRGGRGCDAVLRCAVLMCYAGLLAQVSPPPRAQAGWRQPTA